MDSSQDSLSQVVEVQVELFWLLVTWWQQDGTSPAAQWHGMGGGGRLEAGEELGRRR